MVEHLIPSFKNSLFAILALLLSSSTVFGQSLNHCEIASDIVETARKYHIQPKEVDDDFSQKLFETFISEVNYDGLFISHEDYLNLKKHEFLIDNQILNSECHFLNDLTSIIEDRFDQIIQSIKLTDVSEFDYGKSSYINISKSDTYHKNIEIIKEWKKGIYLGIMLDYFDSTEEEINYQNFKKYLSEELPKSIGMIECSLNQMNSRERNLKDVIATEYLRAISRSFDPHTVYFDPFEQSLFSSSLSKKIESFGLEVIQNENGDIEVIGVLPGGSAWKSNLFNEGDIIEGVLIDGKELKLKCTSEEEFYRLIHESKHIDFKIKKASGNQKEVDLSKEEVDVEDNVFNSYILDGDRKIGYVYLPSFYSSDNESYHISNGCANDFTRELLRLKRDKIEGLIMDLRDNGGGSMLEAIRLAGAFIDFGTIVISKERDEEAISVKDLDRGLVFQKPLILLVNRNSASASELMAAVMQDYNRALIVGEHTFGKATFQKVIPVDAHKSSHLDPNRESKKGYLKLTTGAFYRVNGLSHQKSGVQVDIQIQNEYSKVLGEAKYETALELFAIDKKTYFKPLKELPIEELSSLSSARQKKSQSKRRQTDWSKEDKIPLNFEEFKDFYSDYLSLETEALSDTLSKSEYAFEVKSPESSLDFDFLSASEKENRTLNYRMIQSDLSIIEAYHIMLNYINLIEDEN